MSHGLKVKMISQFLYTLFSSFYLFVVIAGSDSFKWYDKLHESNTATWVELRNYSNARSEVLSNQYLSFSRRELQFDFPFYGTTVKTVSVTTQGFVSMMGETYLRLYETQYVAPLMANFYPRGGEPNQDVRTFQDDSTFIVQWSTMFLVEDEPVTEGTFTFQLHLLKNGTIRFLYKEIPLKVADITDVNHPVVVGISGAYRDTASDGTPDYVPFDTMHVSRYHVTSDTTITFAPRPTCLQQTSCSSCKLLSVHCKWCPTQQMCSTGEDSLKLAWDTNSCSFLSQSECEDKLPVFRNEAPTIEPTSPNGIAIITANATLSVNYVDPGDYTVRVEQETNKNHAKPNNNDMVVIKVLLISTGVIVVFLIVAALLVKRFGWRKNSFISHVKLENKPTDVQHTLIKVDDSTST